MKRYCQTLELMDDPDMIQRYCDVHKQVWPEIMEGQKQVGILDMQIYRKGNRLFLIVDTRDDFDWEKDNARLARLPMQDQWEAYGLWAPHKPGCPFVCLEPWCGITDLVGFTSELGDLRSKFSSTNVSAMNRNSTKVFTERGLYMLATVLKGERARAVTFAIIETFAKVRELKRELLKLHKETDKEKQTSIMNHFGEVLSDIVMPDLQTQETESSLEINFFIGKLKHTVKRVRKEEPKKEIK